MAFCIHPYTPNISPCQNANITFHSPHAHAQWSFHLHNLNNHTFIAADPDHQCPIRKIKDAFMFLWNEKLLFQELETESRIK